MDELKRRALTDSFFPSKQTLQQKPQLRDISEEDESCYYSFHVFLFFFPIHKGNQKGKRCIPLRDSVFLLQTAGFMFSWELVIGGASLSLQNQWHMKAQAFC